MFLFRLRVAIEEIECAENDSGYNNPEENLKKLFQMRRILNLFIIKGFNGFNLHGADGRDRACQ